MQNTLVDLLTKYKVSTVKLKKDHFARGIFLTRLPFFNMTKVLFIKMQKFSNGTPCTYCNVQQCTIGIKTNKIHKENLNASDCDKSGSFALKLLPQHPHISATALQYPAAS